MNKRPIFSKIMVLAKEELFKCLKVFKILFLESRDLFIIEMKVIKTICQVLREIVNLIL